MTSLRAREIFNDAGRRLIAIESVELQQDKTPGSCRCHGMIEPLALIVCSPTGIDALDMQARPTGLAQLRQAVPELDTMLAGMDNT